MAVCPIASDCAFYTGKTTAAPEALAEAKKRFCDSAYEKCARYMVSEAAGADGVPADLQPHQTGTAEVIIAEGETIRFRANRKTDKGGQAKKG